MTILKLRIENSLEWLPIKTHLWEMVFGKVEDVRNCRQLKTLINNIDSKVSELSKAEVEDRRGRSSKREYLIEQINTDIQLVEEFILVAALIG